MCANSIGDGGQLQQATDSIKARYRRKGLMKSSMERDPWPPFHAESFTSLALVYQKIKQLQAKRDAKLAASVRTKGDIDTLFELTSSIELGDIHQIFMPITSNVQSPMCILIEGHPGIGKTMLAKEICIQWANDKLLTSEKLLFLLMLRDPSVQKITSTEELVKYMLPSNQRRNALSFMHTTNGTGITIIIDGFDELNNELRQASFFRELIEGDTMPNARVVVTSRPSASASLHQFIHTRVEILGFTKSSKEQYVNDAFKMFPSELQMLKTHFRQYPIVDALCYIPLNMVIIVFLCLLGSLPPTATEMFSSFILHIVCRHLTRIGEISQCINTIEHLPQQVQVVLQQLEKVAYDGLVEDKIVFTVDDLPGVCQDDTTCYGLLQSVECYSSDDIGVPTQSFNFLHVGIQEYFAAKHVATLTEDEIHKLLKESLFFDNFNDESRSKHVRFSNMWNMYCGITKGHCNSLRCYLSTYQPTSDYGLHGLIECDSDSDSSSSNLPHAHKNNIDDDCSIGDNNTNDDDDDDDGDLPLCSPVQVIHGSVVSLSPILDRLSMSEYTSLSYDSIQSSCEKLFYHFQAFHPTKSTQGTANINTCVCLEKHASISEQDLTSKKEASNIVGISQFILKDPVKILYLFQCFQEAQDDKLCSMLSKSFDGGTIDLSSTSRLLPHLTASLGFFLSKSERSWTGLHLDVHRIGDHGITLLHHYLCGEKAKKHKIRTIDLDHNELTGASSLLIADFITHLQPHTLLLGNNYITSIENIAIRIISTNSVKILHLNNNELTAQEAPAISEMMTSLEELNVDNNKFGDDGAVILALGIAKTVTLKKLDIDSNYIQTTGVIAIANSLLCNTSLKKLSMRYCLLKENGALAIAKVLANNKTLKELLLKNRYSRLNKESIKMLINSLYYNKSIINLELNTSEL